MMVKKFLAAVCVFALTAAGVFAQESEDEYEDEDDAPQMPQAKIFAPYAQVKLGANVFTQKSPEGTSTTAGLYSADVGTVTSRFDFGGTLNLHNWGAKFVLRLDNYGYNGDDIALGIMQHLILNNVYFWAAPFNGKINAALGRIGDSEFASSRRFSNANYDTPDNGGLRLIVQFTKNFKMAYVLPLTNWKDFLANDNKPAPLKNVYIGAMQYHNIGKFKLNLSMAYNSEDVPFMANSLTQNPEEQYNGKGVGDDAGKYILNPNFMAPKSMNMLFTAETFSGLFPVDLIFDMAFASMGMDEALYPNYYSTMQFGLAGLYTTKSDDPYDMNVDLSLFIENGEMGISVKPEVMKSMPSGLKWGGELGFLYNQEAVYDPKTNLRDTMEAGDNGVNQKIVPDNIGIYIKPKASFNFAGGVSVHLWDKIGFDMKKGANKIGNSLQLDFIYTLE